MKKMIIASLIVGTMVSGIWYFDMHKKHDKTNNGNKEYRIAILTPTTHPALEEIEQGFKETLRKINTADYLFTTFNANGNKTLLRAQAEEIVNNDYDLIFTIGATPSQTIVQLVKKKGVTTPHVFCAVDGQKFAQQLTASNHFTTGVYTETDYKTEIDVLRNLKPTTKNVLLVYDPTHGIGLEKDKQEIEQYLKRYDITLHSVEIYQANEIQQKVSALLPSIDVILVLIDNTVVAGIDALITLCNRYGVTLLASDLASGEKGAALAYGITEYESGINAAEKARSILIDNKKPNELPITAVTNFRISINKNTMPTQHLEVDAETIKALKIGFSS